MESFESFIEKGEVRRVSKNKARARKLIKDGEERIEKVNLLDINIFPKFVFENTYDALRDFMLAILLFEGYNTDSHKAPIAFLSKKGFDVYSIDKLDKVRYKRNGSKYYGENILIEEAKDIKAFYIEINDKLFKILKSIKEEQNGLK
jgi:hypothetical protein